MSDDTEWLLGPVLERERVQRGMATREAARRADMSDTMWRNLERGYEIRKGVRFPITPKPETVAKAARAVGVAIDVAFPMAGIDVELAQHHQQEPVDLAGVPDEQLLDEVRRRMSIARVAAPTTEEVLADSNRYTPLGQSQKTSQRRQFGP